VNVLHGRKSISWAKSVLPLFTGASSKPSEKCQIEFKSTPRQMTKTAFKIMLLKAATSVLTGQQWFALATYLFKLRHKQLEIRR